MAYRDELEAARARIKRLEQDLAEAREEDAAEPGPREPVAVVPTMRGRLAKAREAEARVAELEARVAELMRGNDPRVAELQARIAELERGAGPKVTNLEKKLAAARETIAGLEAELTGGSVPSIVEHNRRHELGIEGDAAAVACPLCKLAGDRVEMVLSSHWTDRRHPRGVGRSWALCPRCLYEQALS